MPLETPSEYLSCVHSEHISLSETIVKGCKIYISLINGAVFFKNVLVSTFMVFGGINRQQRWFFNNFSNFGYKRKHAYFATSTNSQQIQNYNKK